MSSKASTDMLPLLRENHNSNCMFVANCLLLKIGNHDSDPFSFVFLFMYNKWKYGNSIEKKLNN